MTQQTLQNLDEAYVGKDLGSREFVATKEVLANYFKGLEIDPSRYSGYSRHLPYGTPVAPSMILAVADGGFPGAGFKNDFGNLWMRQEWDMQEPMVPGETYTCASRVLDIYSHRDRTVVKQEVTIQTPGGKMVAQGRHHQSYLLSQAAGEVKLRDPKTKEGARRFAVPAGEPLEPIERTVTLEMCGTFFHGKANYHTDKGEAQRLGFKEVVVGGRMTMSYIGDIMDRRFGRGWYEGGRLDIKFVNIVWPNDRITARGVVTDRVRESGGTRAKVAVWVEKADGTVAIVGAASALE